MPQSRCNRAQFSLEFMLTYGWALLLLASALGALVYFMPHASSVTPNKCIFSSELSCLGDQFTDANLTVVLRSGLGQSIHNITADLTLPLAMACSVSNSTASDGSRIIITCLNSGYMNLTRDTRFKMQIIYYKFNGVYSQEVLGDIYAKFE